ncbi:MAG: hypothetical protein ACLP01_09255 [Solirubrobacteraceae bacterium]
MIARVCSPALAAAVAGLCLMLSAGALAAPIDVASDRTALSAYGEYAASLARSVAAANRRAGAFAESTETACGGVLAELGSLPPDFYSKAALVDLGREVHDDVALEFDAAAIPAFTRLSGSLSRLHWSSVATATTIRSLISAVGASLALRPSNLCSDAQAFATSPVAEPRGTRALLAAYGSAASTVRRRMTAFLAILERFQMPGEAGEIATADRRVLRYQSISSTGQTAASTQIVHSLFGTAPPARRASGASDARPTRPITSLISSRTLAPTELFSRVSNFG